MTRIGRRFEALRREGRKAFIGFVTAGDPTPEQTAPIALALEQAGVDILELGVPFSDPMADGPSIQASSQRALAAGMTLDKLFEQVRLIRRTSDLPILLMSYLNPILQRGFVRFATECRDAGVDGILATDLSPDEASEWRAVAQGHGLDTIFLAAPTSTQERIRLVAGLSSGFVYCISRTGVTGVRADLTEGLEDLLARVRAETPLPLAVGFGISRPEHVQAVWRFADGAIVGSALVEVIAAEADTGRLEQALTRRVRWLRGEEIPPAQ